MNFLSAYASDDSASEAEPTPTPVQESVTTRAKRSESGKKSDKKSKKARIPVIPPPTGLVPAPTFASKHPTAAASATVPAPAQTWRERAFAHEEGNWPVHVYMPLEPIRPPNFAGSVAFAGASVAEMGSKGVNEQAEAFFSVYFASVARRLRESSSDGSGASITESGGMGTGGVQLLEPVGPPLPPAPTRAATSQHALLSPLTASSVSSAAGRGTQSQVQAQKQVQEQGQAQPQAQAQAQEPSSGPLLRHLHLSLSRTCATRYEFLPFLAERVSTAAATAAAAAAAAAAATAAASAALGAAAVDAIAVGAGEEVVSTYTLPAGYLAGSGDEGSGACGYASSSGSSGSSSGKVQVTHKTITYRLPLPAAFSSLLPSTSSPAPLPAPSLFPLSFPAPSFLPLARLPGSLLALSNDQGTRHFAAALLSGPRTEPAADTTAGDGCGTDCRVGVRVGVKGLFVRIVRGIDAALASVDLPSFYPNPIPHISFASSPAPIPATALKGPPAAAVKRPPDEVLSSSAAGAQITTAIGSNSCDSHGETASEDGRRAATGLAEGVPVALPQVVLRAGNRLYVTEVAWTWG